MTQTALGMLLGVSNVSVSGYENGTRVPDAGTLKTTTEQFGVTVDYLLGINNTPAWASTKQVTDLKEWLDDPDAMGGFSFGGAELTEDEKIKLKMSMTQIF